MALRIGTGMAFHKAGPDIEKALDPVLVFIRGTTNLFELVERRYLGTLENMYVQYDCNRPSTFRDLLQKRSVRQNV